MSAPAPPTPFLPQQPFVLANDSNGLWPAVPVDNEQLEIPPFKRPKISEDYQSMNPVMPIFPQQSFAPANDSNGIWPPIPVGIEQPEIPAFKRQNTLEDNQNMNPRMSLPLRGTGKIFFKTRPCERHRLGLCRNGDSCNFAHGMQDMRKPPPNWQEMVGSIGDDRSTKWEDDQKIITRHRLCKNFYNGRVCPYGERCNYLHEDPGKFREEAGRFRESSVISISTSAAPVDVGARPEQLDHVITVAASKAVCWKTKMCNKWEISGDCPFGDKCHFAHGLAELQKFGGHFEVEMMNANRAPSKPLVNPVNDAPVNTTVVATTKKQVIDKLKWKGPHKISRIYGDWIDDIDIEI